MKHTKKETKTIKAKEIDKKEDFDLSEEILHIFDKRGICAHEALIAIKEVEAIVFRKIFSE